MNEITKVQQLLDPPRGLQPHTAQAARERLMRAAAAPARRRVPRRRLLSVTTAAGAAAVSAAAVVAAMGHVGHGAQPAILTAWTVHRAADGAVTVTLRDFRDPQGLQQSLLAAGVPALVQDGASPCPYPYQAIPGNATLIGQAVVRDARDPQTLAVFTIRPSGIPAGAQLDIVFPYSGGDRAKPAPASPAQPAPAVSPSLTSGASAVAHPVAIRLIPAGQLQCVTPSPGPSSS